MTMQTNSKKAINNKIKSINRDLKICNYCKLKGHLESSCYKKYPNLKPKKDNSVNNIEEIKETVLTTSINNKINNNNIYDFILDSGATIHTCSKKDLFNNIKYTNISIKWGKTNNIIKASGIGDIELYFNNSNLIKLSNVLYIPELGVNLLSLNLITSKGFKLSFNKDNIYIYTPNNKIIAKGKYENKVSVFSAISSKLSNNIINKNNKDNSKITALNTNIENDEIDELSLDYNNNNNQNIIIDKEVNLENQSKELIINNNKLLLNNNSVELLHNRLGHINLNAMKHLVNNAKGVSLNKVDLYNAKVNLDNCIICIQSKLTKNINKEHSTKVNAYLDLLYIDIGGPIRPKTFSGFKYYITFRDSFTKYLYIKLLRTRKDIVNIIESTITELELEAKNNSPNSNNRNINNIINPNFNNNKVKALQLDNEFKSKDLIQYLDKKGIKARYSSPYTPEQNGAAEIINRIILNKVRALLFVSNLPKSLWGEAILTATYLYNRTPNSSIEFKTPYFLKYNKLPNLNNIRIFGSLAYSKEPNSLITKLDYKAIPYYLIGFRSNNIYKLYNPRNNKSIFSRDCKIIEGYFYKPNDNINIIELFNKLDFTKLQNSNLKNNSKNSNNNNNKPSSKKNITINKPKVIINRNEEPIPSRISTTDNYSEDELANNTTITKENYNNINHNLLDNNKNNWEYLYNNSIIENILNISNNKCINYNNLEPKSYKEVLINPNKDLYLEAMRLEIDNLIKNNTWDLTLKPKNNNKINIIKGRWVLNKKLNLDNTIKKYKARWVTKGFLQKYNINYKETFASTSKPSLIRLLLSIFNYLDWEIYHWDIKQAFPNADIDINNIYIQLPIGLEDYILKKALLNEKFDLNLINNIKIAVENKSYKNIICKLNKALYGLKQASRQWQIYLTNILNKLDFISLKTDNSIFINKNKPIVLATHVDDILVFSKDLNLVKELYNNLTKISNLEITNLGEIKEFLGVEIIRDRSKKSLVITQRSFINKILNKFNKVNNKAKTLPLPIGFKISKNSDLDLNNNTIIKDYQKEIGSLIYITIFTRPDLVYSINYLARFMSNPTLDHYNYLNKIWSYLVHTKNLGLDLTLEPNNQSNTNYSNSNKSINLIGVSDSDWGGDLDSRKSTTGNIFIINNNKDNNYKNIAISWISKLQKTVAISSAEAEYIALKEATKESLYLQNFIKELFSYNIFKDYDLFNKVNLIKTDSLSAIELAKNPIYHARTKHIDITYHFIRDNLYNNNIDLLYENTSTILADNLTKPTNSNKFEDYKNRIGLVKINNL